jgi:hypothetical protein
MLIRLPVLLLGLLLRGLHQYLLLLLVVVVALMLTVAAVQVVVAVVGCVITTICLSLRATAIP